VKQIEKRWPDVQFEKYDPWLGDMAFDCDYPGGDSGADSVGY
jgi:hypothetical protein